MLISKSDDEVIELLKKYDLLIDENMNVKKQFSHFIGVVTDV